MSPADPLNFVIEHPGACEGCGGPTCLHWPPPGAAIHCGAGHRPGGTDCGWRMDLPPIPADATGVTVVPNSITCPRCAMTSWHPRDVATGYCGNCHDWTHR